MDLALPSRTLDPHPLLLISSLSLEPGLRDRKHSDNLAALNPTRFLRRKRYKTAINAASIAAPRATPTPIPALAPLLRLGAAGLGSDVDAGEEEDVALDCPTAVELEVADEDVADEDVVEL
ncbi:MAG: hypothetical protein Q9169_002665 [Polycauliona sp. 2 TL-2023]